MSAETLCAREGCGLPATDHRESAAGNLYCWDMEGFWRDVKAAYNAGKPWPKRSTDAFLAVTEDAGTPPDHCPECGCSKWNGIGLQDKNVHFPHCSRVSPSDSGAPCAWCAAAMKELAIDPDFTGRGFGDPEDHFGDCPFRERAETPPAPTDWWARRWKERAKHYASNSRFEGDRHNRLQAQERAARAAERTQRNLLRERDEEIEALQATVASLSSLQAETQRQLAEAEIVIGAYQERCAQLESDAESDTESDRDVMVSALMAAGFEDADEWGSVTSIAARLWKDLFVASTQRDAARRALKELRHAGAMLSNCAYNLAQRDGFLSVNDRESLDRSRKEWDAVIASLPSTDPRP